MRFLILLLAVPAAATFTAAPLPPKDPAVHSMNAKAADVNGDGAADLVIAVERGRNRLLLGDGRGGFTDASANLPPAARDSEETAIADFDGDGDPDIAVANEDDLLPELYLNDGRGRFTDASARVRHRVKANAVVAFDADGDGDQDLFFGGDKVSLLLVNDGRANFTDESAARLPDTYGGTQHVAVADLDGDRDLDLVLGNEDRNQIYLNTGRGAFMLAPAASLPRPPAPEETRDVEVFDANGDGRPDLFFANTRLWNPRATPRNRLLLNAGPGPDGSPRFADASGQLPALEENTMSALAIDLNGDGRLDLVTTGIAADLAGPDPAGPVRALINSGTAFEDRTRDWLPANTRARGFDATAVSIGGGGPALFISGRGGPDLLLRPESPTRGR